MALHQRKLSILLLIMDNKSDKVKTNYLQKH
jgi:hypothetical protein